MLFSLFKAQKESKAIIEKFSNTTRELKERADKLDEEFKKIEQAQRDKQSSLDKLNSSVSNLVTTIKCVSK